MFEGRGRTDVMRQVGFGWKLIATAVKGVAAIAELVRLRGVPLDSQVEVIMALSAKERENGRVDSPRDGLCV